MWMISFPGNDVLVGVYGGKLEDGVIQYMSFVIFNAQAGNVNVQGLCSYMFQQAL
jgi:hypothetical protein